MSITLQIPGVLRAYSNGATKLKLAASTVKGALEQVEREHPDLYRCICDETGAVRRHVNVFVNTVNVRDGEGLETVLALGDTVTILPAVSGG